MPIYPPEAALSTHFSPNFNSDFAPNSAIPNAAPNSDPDAANPNRPPNAAASGAARRAIFMGTPQFATPALDALASNPAVAVVAAVTPPDRARGRGRRTAPTPVKQRAHELNIPVIQPPTLRHPDAIAALAAYRPDLIVVAAYGQLLPPPVLELPPLGCLNLHPSLLPKHRGPSPVAGAILAGDATTGVSIMRLDAGMDTGPIIAQSQRPITLHDDAATLTAILFKDGAILLNQIIPQWAAGAITATPQDDTQATYTAKIERSDGLANWNLPAHHLTRIQRAYTPWPGLYTRWDGQELKLLTVSAIPGAATPGLVIAPPTNDLPLAIGTGEGLLAAHTLQLEGRRPASGRDLLRGYPGLAGARLG